MRFFASILVFCFLFALMPVSATRFFPFLFAGIVYPRNSDSRFRRLTICDFSGETSSLRRSYRYKTTFLLFTLLGAYSRSCHTPSLAEMTITGDELFSFIVTRSSSPCRPGSIQSSSTISHSCLHQCCANIVINVTAKRHPQRIVPLVDALKDSAISLIWATFVKSRFACHSREPYLVWSSSSAPGLV